MEEERGDGLELDGGSLIFVNDERSIGSFPPLHMAQSTKQTIDLIHTRLPDRSVSLMERSLDVVEKLQEEEGVESSAYSAHFHTDNVTPSKKGQRETIPLLLKVFHYILVSRAVRVRLGK